MRMFAVLFALISVCVYMLLVGVPAIQQWERAAGYPYGRMCDANVFNLSVNLPTTGGCNG